MVTDAAAVYPRVLDELIPSAWHPVERYATIRSPVETDAGATNGHAHVIIAGHAFMQNLGRGHYELAVDVQPNLRVAAAFTELAQAI